MKKQVWMIVSTVLKTVYLTPIIVFIMLVSFDFLHSIDYGYKTIYIVATIIALLGLLAVFAYDVVRNRREHSEKAGRLSYFLYLGIPAIWFVVATVFLLVIMYSGVEFKYVFGGLFFSYLIGVVCLLAALVIDRLHKKSRVTPDLLLYSLYVAIPVIWLVILFFLIINNMKIGFL